MTEKKGKALVVLSGGQDSTTCLGWALDRYEHVSCITFDYNQRHATEIEAACNVVKHFQRAYGREIPHMIMGIPPAMLASSSPLTDKGAELETYKNHDQMAEIIGDRVEKTFVPMRNTLFLTIAANRAVAGGCDTIVTGICQEDNSNYPDCTNTFRIMLRNTFNKSLGWGVGKPLILDILAPLMHKSKADTVQMALDTPYTYGALAWSHTAYDGKYPPTGKDHASLLRAHGFEQANRPDPLVLRAHREGLMPLPDTPNYARAEAYISAMKDQW